MDVLTDISPSSDINAFMGEYFFLSNFYVADVLYNGIIYPSNEHAYQAQKSNDPKIWETFSKIPTAGKAKREGRTIELRKDWEYIRVGVMYNCVHAKFSQHADLGAMLQATGDRNLIEGNNWGDRYWGTVNGVGENVLGVILMNVRCDLKNT